MSDEFILHWVAREGAIAETRGMVMSVWRDLLTGQSLREIRAALVSAHARRRARVTTLSIYKLPKLSAIGMANDGVRGEIVATLRAVDQQVVASASVLDMGEFLTATLRSAIAGVQLVARPRVALKVFPSLPPALGWLLPMTPDKGGVEAAAHFTGAVAKLNAAHEAHRAAGASAHP